MSRHSSHLLLAAIVLASVASVLASIDPVTSTDAEGSLMGGSDDFDPHAHVGRAVREKLEANHPDWPETKKKIIEKWQQRAKARGSNPEHLTDHLIHDEDAPEAYRIPEGLCKRLNQRRALEQLLNFEHDKAERTVHHHASMLWSEVREMASNIVEEEAFCVKETRKRVPSWSLAFLKPVASFMKKIRQDVEKYIDQETKDHHFGSELHYLYDELTTIDDIVNNIIPTVQKGVFPKPGSKEARYQNYPCTHFLMMWGSHLAQGKYLGHHSHRILRRCQKRGK